MNTETADRRVLLAELERAEEELPRSEDAGPAPLTRAEEAIHLALQLTETAARHGHSPDLGRRARAVAEVLRLTRRGTEDPGVEELARSLTDSGDWERDPETRGRARGIAAALLARVDGARAADPAPPEPEVCELWVIARRGPGDRAGSEVPFWTGVEWSTDLGRAARYPDHRAALSGRNGLAREPFTYLDVDFLENAARFMAERVRAGGDPEELAAAGETLQRLGGARLRSIGVELVREAGGIRSGIPES